MITEIFVMAAGAHFQFTYSEPLLKPIIPGTSYALQQFTLANFSQHMTMSAQFSTWLYKIQTNIQFKALGKNYLI